MIIIVDTNIIIAALLRNGLVRTLLNTDEEFIIPSFLFEELCKHQVEIFEKSKVSKAEFENVLTAVFENITVAPVELTDAYFETAFEVMEYIDPKDTEYLACSLAFPGIIIWSDDPDFKEQDLVKAINTREMKQLLNQ
jgi:predicted nucleic acid-binding protein